MKLAETPNKDLTRELDQRPFLVEINLSESVKTSNIRSGTFSLKDKINNRYVNFTNQLRLYWACCASQACSLSFGVIESKNCKSICGWEVPVTSSTVAF